MTTLSRRYRFSASHRLCAPSFSDERNREVFGKCANAFGHGHNYCLEVGVGGDPDRASGLTLARADFDRWVADSVLRRIDHLHLNSDVPDFQTLVPTAENILLVVEAWLRAGWPEHFPGQAFRLARLRLEETPRNACEIPLEDLRTIHDDS